MSILHRRRNVNERAAAAAATPKRKRKSAPIEYPRASDGEGKPHERTSYSTRVAEEAKRANEQTAG